MLGELLRDILIVQYKVRLTADGVTEIGDGLVRGSLAWFEHAQVRRFRHGDGVR